MRNPDRPHYYIGQTLRPYPISVYDMNSEQRQHRDHIRFSVVVSDYFGKTLETFVFEGRADVAENVMKWRIARWKELMQNPESPP